MADFTRFYGMLLDTMDMAYPGGIAYRRMVPVAEDQVPQRLQRAEEVFEGKLWREQLRDWEEVAKPTSVKAHRELQAVDPDALSNEELAEYVERCHAHHSEMIYQHMRFTGAAMLSIGDLLAHLADWTTVPSSEVLAMMQGAAPVSAGASAELDRLVTALNEDASARALLESEGDAAQVLDKLGALDNEVSEALSGYLDLVGYRLLDGFDISGHYALEMPDALLRAVRSFLRRKGGGAGGVEARTAAIRAQVPEEHRSEFDELLEEARLMYRVARRARRFQRHLGVGHRPPGGAFGRTAVGPGQSGPRS